MVKKPDAKGAEGAKKAGSVSKTVARTIKVVEGDKRPSDELMKLPKAQIIREMSVPEDMKRFMVDVNNKTKKGKTIIALLERLRDGDAAAIKEVTKTLEDLATMMAKKPTAEK